MDEKGQFKEILCMNNIKGVLSLYEASYLSTEDESIMGMAQKFSIHNMKKYLKQKMDDRDKNNTLVKQVSHALDFNMLQAKYLDELKQLSRWHENMNLVETMRFTRDRLVEFFFLELKLGELTTIIDDMYELHGTLEELVLFTDMVDSYQAECKCVFLALFNSVNELAYDILKEQDINILPYLRKSCIELFKTYLVDAKWYYEYDKYTPSFKEHGWVSIGGPLVIKFFYICTMNPIKKDDLELLEQNLPLIQLPSLIGRLEDDLGTSQGDAPKSIQCYMMETKNSEENVRDYIKELIGQTWKKMNKVVMDNTTSLSKDFVRILQGVHNA
ncbi:hypothetical protein H5410_015858 [Solanum commersonii]|uniref:Uncharacterized protein n=1 Tax=Solanum commersonii TaxID=4109 RepID=A0A9J5ZVN0_SOLCO|nr:hypothetical protein H5410_015858 [Solanum commersonii]